MAARTGATIMRRTLTLSGNGMSLVTFGPAAAAAVRGKRCRYPPSGGELVPLVFEAGGRPADETVAYVRTWGHGLAPGERSEVIRYGWQQLSNRLQIGNAEMILSSIG